MVKSNFLVKQSIIDSSNKYLFIVPYTPKTNAIEMWFNQIKQLKRKILEKSRIINNLFPV